MARTPRDLPHTEKLLPSCEPTRRDTPIRKVVTFCLRTVSALTPCEVSKSAKQVDFTEVRAECFNEIQFAVCGLPQHEIRDALLARGSNDKVKIGLTGGI